MNTNSIFGVKLGPETAAPKRHVETRFLVLGIALILCGFVGLINPSLATLVSVVVYGWLLLLAGAFETAAAMRTRNETGFALRLFSGILALAAGGVMVLRPNLSALTLSLVLAGFFLLGGLFRIAAALALRFPHWGWSAVGGALTTLLGVLIWAQWPLSGLWVIGLFVAIELVNRGWAWVMFATRPG